MKNLFILFLVLFSFKFYPQSVGNVRLSEINASFIAIESIESLFSVKITLRINYGQKIQFLSSNNEILRDENQQDIQFNSIIDALNFLSAYGYEFVAIRNSPNLENIKECFILKKNKDFKP